MYIEPCEFKHIYILYMAARKYKEKLYYVTVNIEQQQRKKRRSNSTNSLLELRYLTLHM